ncbi:MAG: hypothetical protein ACE5FD_10080 [Anaerolineae bacterium]
MMVINWVTLLLGVGLFLSPAILGFADHIPDSRISILPGMVIMSVAFWKFGNPDAGKWPPILLCLSGITVIAGSLLLGGIGGHTHLIVVGFVTGVPVILLGARGYMRTRPE